MGKYIIHELQNLESVRKGEIYEGTLHGAKAKATREQVQEMAESFIEEGA